MKRTTFVLSLVSLLVTAPARATEQEIHENVKHSLVQLTTTGTARIGPQTGTPVTGKGTGFFVGSDGYILTTAHLFDPLKEVNAANASIEAKFEGTGTGSVKVVYVSELASLDLVLLRAIVDNGIAVPPSLEIGDSKDVNIDDPALLTSGYDLTGYRRPPMSFNSTSNALAAFAWTLNGRTNSGASGSPVYIDQNGKPLVVGILSATAKDDDQLSLMIPIEYSFQLIGQLKMKELQEQVAQLIGMIGQLSEGARPINPRLVDVEANIEELKTQFTWSASPAEDGSLVVRYDKMISNGANVDKIKVKITPNMRFKGDGTPYSTSVQVLKYGGSDLIDRQQSAEGPSKFGIFVIPGVKDALLGLLNVSLEAVGGPEPFQELDVAIVPLVDGELPTADVESVERHLFVTNDDMWWK